MNKKEIEELIKSIIDGAWEWSAEELLIKLYVTITKLMEKV